MSIKALVVVSEESIKSRHRGRITGEAVWIIDDRKAMIVLSIQGGVHLLNFEFFNWPLRNVTEDPVLRFRNGGCKRGLHSEHGSILGDVLLPLFITFLGEVVINAVLHNLVNSDGWRNEIMQS